MKQKKILTLFLTIAMSFSMLVGCGNSTSAESKGTVHAAVCLYMVCNS